MNKSEKLVLQAYLELPIRKLLGHKYELDEDYIAGYVSRFLHGERFDIEFEAYTSEAMEEINSIIAANIDNQNGKDLLTAVLITQTVCNIMNKYRELY